MTLSRDLHTLAHLVWLLGSAGEDQSVLYALHCSLAYHYIPVLALAPRFHAPSYNRETQPQTAMTQANIDPTAGIEREPRERDSRVTCEGIRSEPVAGGGPVELEKMPCVAFAGRCCVPLDTAVGLCIATCPFVPDAVRDMLYAQRVVWRAVPSAFAAASGLSMSISMLNCRLSLDD
jgi:hypothetical protein